jgi:hypothetical protein
MTTDHERTALLLERAITLICDEWGPTRQRARAWLENDDADWDYTPDEPEAPVSPQAATHPLVASTMMFNEAQRKAAELNAADLAKLRNGPLEVKALLEARIAKAQEGVK